MTDKKVLMKINRYIKPIGRKDLILDNGSCIQVTTQCGSRGDFGYAPLIMSKKLFRDLKSLGFIFVDEKMTEISNKQYKKPLLKYYRFDIDRLISSGYEVWKGGEER